MGVRRRAARWLLVLLLLGLVVWGATAGAVLWAADAALAAHLEGRSIGVPVEAIIVLGAGMSKDGGLGPASRRRVAAAVAAYEAGKTEALIVSGGPAGKVGTPVATFMRAHAVALGLPPDVVLVEARAGSTFENLRYSFEMAERHGMERLALASDAYHLARARALAALFGKRSLGLVAASGPSTVASMDASVAILREALAWWYNLGKAAAWEGLGLLGWEPAQRAALVG